MIGFVEELRVAPDPEYHWRDLIRSSRASNEARLACFYQTGMQVYTTRH